MAIYVENNLILQQKIKLDIRCSNNQAEQLAITKALEVIETIEIAENSPRTITVFIDSRIATDSLKNVNIRSYLVEEFRKKVHTLERTKWTI